MPVRAQFRGVSAPDLIPGDRFYFDGVLWTVVSTEPVGPRFQIELISRKGKSKGLLVRYTYVFRVLEDLGGIPL